MDQKSHNLVIFAQYNFHFNFKTNSCTAHTNLFQSWLIDSLEEAMCILIWAKNSQVHIASTTHWLIFEHNLHLTFNMILIYLIYNLDCIAGKCFHWFLNSLDLYIFHFEFWNSISNFHNFHSVDCIDRIRMIWLCIYLDRGSIYFSTISNSKGKTNLALHIYQLALLMFQLN